MSLQQQMEGLSLQVVEPGKVHQREMDGVGSVYAFQLKPGQLIYRYDVEIVNLSRTVERNKDQQPVSSDGRTNGFKSLTSGASDDGQKGRNNALCFDIILALYNMTQGFGTGKQAQYVYDNRKNLFSNIQLRPDTQPYDIPPQSLSELVRRYLRDASVRVEIKPNLTSAVLNLSDLRPSIARSPDVSADQSLRSFLELLTSQPFLNARTHDLIGPGRLFERKPLRILDDGIALHRGVAKGARIIENAGTPMAALVIDAKTCAFFESVTADRTVEKMLSRQRGGGPDRRFWDRWLDMYKGVRVCLTYAPSRTVVIGSVSTRTVGEFTFDMDGRTVDMVTYFREHKNIDIGHPEWPAIKAEHDREAAYPLQCLLVLPNQRVPIEKMNDYVSRELLNANTTLPEVRYQSIDDEVRRIGLLEPMSDAARFMLLFGVKLQQAQDRFNNTVKIGVRHPPQIKFGDKEFTPVSGKFDERQPYRYYCAGTPMKYWVVGFPRRVERSKVEKFINDVSRTAGQKGLQLPRPEFHNVECDEIATQMGKFAEKKVPTFFVYIDNKHVKSHTPLKLNEKRFGILTQHVSYEVIFNERQGRPAGPATVTNVVNKMNMKLSFATGLNYMPIFEKIALNRFDLGTGKLLVIGVDTSSAPKATPYEKYTMRKKEIDGDSLDPMVVGVCANYLTQAHNFAGDYFYQQSKLNTIDPELLKEKIKWVLGNVKKNRPGKVPEMIFIVRDGVSEGQVPACIQNEMPAFQKACQEFAPGYKPKFIFCIVDKKHNKRFFSRIDGKVQNPVPCSVVDKKVVRPDIHEFYMQSHLPLKGTSKMCQYVFPVNEPKATNDELQAFLNGLCYSWQIVNLAPALPVPVRQAHELAKRGRNNYMELKRANHNAIPMKDGGLKVDFVALTKKLAYEGYPLASTRFTA